MVEALATVVWAMFAGVVAMLFWCDVAAWSRDCWQQRRFDRWHRRRLLRRLRRSLAVGGDASHQPPASGVHDVSRRARQIRRSAGPGAYGMTFFVMLLMVTLPWQLWHSVRGMSSRRTGAPATSSRYRTTGEGARRASVLRGVSVLVFVLALLVFATFTPASALQEDSWSPAESSSLGAAVVLGGALLAFGVFALRSARRATVLSAPEARASEQPMVLYLRSFGDDRLRMRARGSARHALIERLAPGRRDFVEEVIADKLWRYGPVVAVSQPGDTQPPIGAAREQLSDDQWRSAVEQRMSEAALIVVMVGRTTGLAWEVETLVRLGLWQRVLWVFPPVDVIELERRWAATQQLLCDHGGPSGGLGAEPGDVLLARSAFGREVVAYTAVRRDEWAYEAALEAAAGRRYTRFRA